MTKNPNVCVSSEESVLGAMLLNPDCHASVMSILGQDPEVFSQDATKTIYSEILELVKTGCAVDIVTLGSHLMHSGKSEACGGITYVASLASSTPTSANAEHYATTVRKMYELRQIGALARSLHFASIAPGADPSEVMSMVQKESAKISGLRGDDGLVLSSDEVEETINRIVSMYDTGSTGGLLTGFEGIDNIVNGFEDGNLIVIGARPGVGKSALALNIAANVADRGKNVLFFTMEMSRSEVNQRIAYMRGGLSKQKVQSRFISRNELGEKLIKATNAKCTRHIWIDDTVRSTPMQIRAKCLRFASKNEVALIVVDYLQIVSPTDSKARREEQVAEISRSMKMLAGEIGCPVIALSQLRRDGALRDKPSMSDLRESGAIEQDANLVMLMWSDEMDLRNVSIEKNRSGPTGAFQIVFDRSTQNFRNYAGSGIKKPEMSEADKALQALSPIEDRYNDDPSEQW